MIEETNGTKPSVWREISVLWAKILKNAKILQSDKIVEVSKILKLLQLLKLVCMLNLVITPYERLEAFNLKGL